MEPGMLASATGGHGNGTLTHFPVLPIKHDIWWGTEAI